MAHDLSKPYDYPFELPPEDEIRFKDGGAVEGRPAGVPSSYDEGGSARWTPEAISEVHALAQLGLIGRRQTGPTRQRCKIISCF